MPRPKEAPAVVAVAAAMEHQEQRETDRQHRQHEQAISEVFQECQNSKSTHRSKTIKLRKTHRQLLGVEGGEEAFNAHFIHCIARILPLKKSISNGEKVALFVESFMRDALQQAEASNITKKQNRMSMDSSNDNVEDDNEEEEEDNFAIRLYEKTLKFLMRGVKAKDKNVRFRCCRLMTKLLEVDAPMDPDFFNALLSTFMVFAKDKEVTVRYEAVGALALAQSIEGEEGEMASEMLITMMETDERAEVRKRALLEIEINAHTMKLIAERVRDIDAQVRSAVFRKIMQNFDQIKEFLGIYLGDILASGLDDRDANVRKWCARMLDEALLSRSGNDLVALANLLNSMENEAMVAAAIEAILLVRPDIKLDFGAGFWAELTPDKLFVARVIGKFYLDNKQEDRLDDIFPLLSHHIEIMNNLFDAYDMDNDEVATAEYAFSINQLLQMAAMRDYADDFARSAMANALKQIFETRTKQVIEDSFTSLAVETYRKLSRDENEFIERIRDLVSELREPIDYPDGSADDDIRLPTRLLSQEEQRITHNLHPDDEVYIKLTSLEFIAEMLRRLTQPIQNNTELKGINKYVSDALADEDDIIRDVGLKCALYACYLSKEFTVDNIDQLFLPIAEYMKNGENLLGIDALKGVLDLVTLYGFNALAPWRHIILECFSETLEEGDDQFLAITVVGLCKMIILGVFRDESQRSSDESAIAITDKFYQIFESLLSMFFLPEYQEFYEVIQCLNYFLTMYSAISFECQKVLAKVCSHVFPLVIKALKEDHENVNSKMAHMGSLVAQWTNPENLEDQPQECLHAHLAIELLKQLKYILTVSTLGQEDVPEAVQDLDSTDVKAYMDALLKLKIDHRASEYELFEISKLLGHIKNNISMPAVVSSFTKFANNIAAIAEEKGYLGKRYSEQEVLNAEAVLRRLDEQTSEEAVDVQERSAAEKILRARDISVNLNMDDVEKKPPRGRRPAKRQKVTEDDTTSEITATVIVPSSRRDRGKRRASQRSDSSESGEDDSTRPTLLRGATRKTPRSAKAAKISIEEDSERGNENPEATLSVRSSRRQSARLNNNTVIEGQEKLKSAANPQARRRGRRPAVSQESD